MSEETTVPTPVTGKSTRRDILGTGVKLSYAAPLVAASFKLSASGALAGNRGDHDYKNCCWPDRNWDHGLEGGNHYPKKYDYAVCKDGEFACLELTKDEAQKLKDGGATVIKVEDRKVCLPDCGGNTVSL